METRFLKNHELDDIKIIESLRKAAAMYENGEISEVRDELLEIVKALDEFENNYI